MWDTHCHFDFLPFQENPALWIQRSQAVGVDRILIPAVKRETWRSIIQLSNDFSELFYGLGLHPMWIDTHQTFDLIALEDELKKDQKSCVAIGEIGLDFSISNPDRVKQFAFFRAQMKLAEQYQKPVILHCRKAHNELIQVLNEFPSVFGVLHGFSGSEQMGHAFIQRGFYLGIGGTITYLRAQKTRQAVANLPLSRLILETDAPDMPICGFQGEPNLPERLPYVAQALAALKNMPVEQLIQITTDNAHQCFLR